MSRTRLLFGSSEANADILYATRFMAPDPFFWWAAKDATHIALNRLEIDRGRAQAKVDHVHSVEELLGEGGGMYPGPAALAEAIARAFHFSTVEVPADFPLGIARALEEHGVRLKVAAGEFFPERQIKTAEEIRHITRAQRTAEAGLARGLEVLRAAKPDKRGVLQWGGTALTSERLRGEIDAEVVRRGGLPADTIVAGGNQGCDPHERGHGPLRANQSIILDIFPRDSRSGYFGDLTRTVVRGRASEALRAQYAAVAKAKQWVMRQMKPGADGRQLHEAVVERFREAGYPTEQRKGRWVGFFHGTGHSLGLEIHEPPRFAAGEFREGVVMTVEPGLYYPGVGGVRLEDLVVVTKTGVRNLTRVPQQLEL